MTKEEAVRILEQVRQWTDYPKEAFTKAIEALSEPSIPSDLDEAAEEYGNKFIHPDCKAAGEYGFKAGAVWMAGQGEKG